MGILRVTLLGGVRVTHNNWISEDKLTREIQTLLAYLLVYRQRAHPRETLAGVLWEEHSPEKARRALNTALWRLKKALEPDGVPSGTYLLSAHPEEVGFNHHSQYWLDVEIFEQQITHLTSYSIQSMEETNVQELEKILNLYRGELLEGFYDEWALRERERLRALYIKSLRYLMEFYRIHGAYEKAITYGQQTLDLDPLREDVHREMMKLYLDSGQRALAAKQYAMCQLTLLKELGISPMEETQALYAQLFPEACKSHLPNSPREGANFAEILGQLHQATETLEIIRWQVQQAVVSITSYAENQKNSTGANNRGKTARAKSPGKKQHLE